MNSPKLNTYQYRPANLYAPTYDLFLSKELYFLERDRINAFFVDYRVNGGNLWCNMDPSARLHRKDAPHEEGVLFTFKDKEAAALFKLAFDAKSIIS